MGLTVLMQARHIGKIVVAQPEDKPIGAKGRYAAVAITGGLGMLGKLMANWLLQHCVSHILLMGRSARGNLQRLSSTSSVVTAVQVDGAAQEDAMMLQNPRGPGVSGFFHAGGVLSDATLPRQTASAMRMAFGPKAAGALSCSAALKGLPIQTRVLFSSTSALLGSPGQASYASANSSLDGLAASWDAQGDAALCIQWGPWGGGGMALADAGTSKRLERWGMGLILPQVGLSALEGALHAQHGCRAPCGFPHVAVAPMQWALFMQSPAAAQPGLGIDTSLCAKDATDDAAPGMDASAEAAGISSFESMLQNGDAAEVILAVVRRTAVSVIGNEVDDCDPLFDAGLDSLGAVEFRNTLTMETGMTLSATLLFDYSTIAEVASCIESTIQVRQLEQDKAAECTDAPEVMVPGMEEDPEVAEIGRPSYAVGLPDKPQTKDLVVTDIAARLPGGLFSEGCAQQHDASTPILLPRWDVDTLEPTHLRTTGRHGMLLDDDSVYCFDSAIFRIHNSEAAVMDPQQRVLLDTAVEMGGSLMAREANNMSVGVYLGIWPGFYHEYLLPRSELGAYHATGSAISAAAGRVSFMFGFTGPSISVDTACSASMIATHLAANGVQAGNCQVAVSAGVGLLLTPTLHTLIGSAGMLSPEARCKALDASADGYVRAEACVCMAIEQTEVREHHLALIHGSAVSQDARSSSLTSPSGRAQQAVIQSSCRQAGVLPSALRAAQLHSTGTSLGDPIEIGAVCGVLNGSNDPGWLHIQACKSNAGHTEAAAGATGLLYAFELQARQSVLGLQHLRNLNPHVADLKHSSTQACTLVAPRQKAGLSSMTCSALVGTSSFAFQGTNGHLISSSASRYANLGVSSLSRLCSWETRSSVIVKRLESHYFLQSCRITEERVAFEGRASQARASFLWDHCVRGRVLLPGAGLLDAAHAAASQMLEASQTPALCNVSLIQPLQLPGGERVLAGEQRICCLFYTGTRRIRITSEPGSHVHMMASLACVSSVPPLAAALERSPRAAAARQWALLPQEKPLQVPCADVAAPALAGAQDEANTGPMVLDSCLHLGQQISREGEQPGVTYVPMGIEALVLVGRLGSCGRTSAIDRGVGGGGSLRVDHVFNSAGEAGGTIAGFEAKPLREPSGRGGDRKGRAKAEAHPAAPALVRVHWGVHSPCGPSLSWAGARDQQASLQLTKRGTKSFGSLDALSSCISIEAALQAGTAADSKSLSCIGGLGMAADVSDSVATPAGTAAFSNAVSQGAIRGMLQTSALELGVKISAAALDANGRHGHEPSLTLEPRAGGAPSQPGFNAVASGCAQLTGILNQHENPQDFPCLVHASLTRAFADSTVVITGGLGMLGHLVAGWLLHRSRDTTHVLLLGRTAHALRHGSFTGTGSLVTSQSCDVSTAEDSSCLSCSGGHPLGGLFHASGSLADATLQNQTPSGMRVAAAGKVSGALQLQNQLQCSALSFGVMFSSTAALLGSQGQASYAASNAALDNLCTALQQQGRNEISVQWGPWSGGGMAYQDAGTEARMRRMGIGLVSPMEGLEALCHVLSHSTHVPARQPGVLAVCPMDWNTFRKTPTGQRQMLEFASAEPEAGDTTTAASNAAVTFKTADAIVEEGSPHVAAQAATRKRESVRSAVNSALQTVLGTEVEENEPFTSAGMDSLGAVELKSALQQEIGLNLPATIVFDYPTAAELVGHLEGLVPGAEDSAHLLDAAKPAINHAPAAISAPPEASQARHTFIYNVASKLPTEMDSLSTKCAPSAVPVSRWDVESAPLQILQPAARHAKLVLSSDVSIFDADLFGVAGTEASLMDPQQRLLLEVTAEHVTKCVGQTASVGVFVGIWEPDYNHDIACKHVPQQQTSPFQATGSVMSVAAGRLSFMFGLKGPCMSIDTACSASLVATHLASQAILQQECAAGMASGANLVLSPGKYFTLVAANMLSPSGQCQTLDSTADGYVRGEAVISLLLSQQDLEDQGPGPLAVLKGSSINQDGRSSSLTSPHGPSQQNVISVACDLAGVSPSDLDAIQTHGTGTQLGDPIEVGAIRAVSNTSSPGDAHHVLALQACKSFLGHGEAAAGSAGMLAALAALGRSSCQAFPHLRHVNPHVMANLHFDLDASSAPVILASRQSGPMGSRGSAQPLVGVSSFAYQGTNSHVVTSGVSSGGRTGLSRSRLQNWSRRRFWAASARHHYVLAAAAAVSSRPGVMRLQGEVSAAALAFVADHVVQSKVLVPGAAFMELAASAANLLYKSSEDEDAANGLRKGSIIAPFLLEPLQQDQSTSRLITVDMGLPNGKIDLGQASGDAFAPKQQRHLTCWMARVRGWNQRPVVQQLAACAHSALLLRDSLPVGAGPVAAVSPCGMQEISGSACGMAVHPAVLDSSLHMGHLVAHAKNDNVTYVPSGFDSLMLTLDDASCDSGSHFSSANPHPRSSKQCVVLNYNLAHPDEGKTGVSLGGFQAKPMRQAGADKHREHPPPVARTAPSWLSVSWLAASPPQRNEEGAGEGACSDVNIGRSQAGHHLAATFEGFLQQTLGESAVRLSMAQPGMAHSLLAARPVPSGMPGTDSTASSSGALWGLVQTAGLEHRGGISATVVQRGRSRAAAGLQIASKRPEKQAERPVEVESMGTVHHNAVSSSLTFGSASLPAGRGFERLRGTTWAISGGMGMLGLLTGRWLQARGVSRLLLLGRSAHHACPEDMAASQGLLCLTACDVSTKGDLPLVDDSNAGSIYGMVSAGGVLSDATLGRQTARDMRTSWAPKVRGALNAWENVKCRSVQVSILYSSIASLLGSAAQASYASSNAAADALAASWRAQGVSGQSIQWGPWGGGGMADTDPGMATRMLKLGIGMLRPAEGVLAFSRILGVQNPVVAVIDISWNAYAEKFRGVLPLLSLPAAEEPSVDRPAKGQASRDSAVPTPQATESDLVEFPMVQQDLPFAGADDLSESILRVVKGAFGAEMADQITEHTPLSEAGLDSLSAVELRDSLEESMGVSMPSTVIFDYPTVRELAEWVATQVQPVQPKPLPPRPAVATMNPSASVVPHWESTAYSPLASLPVCLTSIAAKVPNGTGACANTPASWDQTFRVPLSRWDSGASKGPQSPGVSFGKFLTSDPALFDSAAFGISGMEAVTMDPQQRQLLECITDVSLDSGALVRDTGVFLGIWPTDYADLIAQFCPDHAPYNATGAAISAAAGRMSYTFGFQGPSVSIDTACSAALVGVHWGRGSLQSQECSAALCCGVNMILTPFKSELLSSAGMLSATGSCKALDADADGYARGEAVICMLLQPGAEGSEALALVPGSFVNQDGRSSSLTAPSGPSQQAVVRQACASASKSPPGLGAAQMHGTGTSLGDPIEVGALASLLAHQNAGAEGSPLPEEGIRLQASKSWNAHCEAAAGLVGMLGAMDMHTHQRIAPIRHLRVLNTHVEPWIGGFSGQRPGVLSAGRVSSSWAAAGAGRGANVSSFAYQGTNCSVIVDGAYTAKATTDRCLPVWDKDLFWAIPATNHRIFKTTAMNTPDSRRSSVRFEGSLRAPGLAFLSDHFVQEKALVPGACFIEASAMAGEQLQHGAGHRSPMMLARCSIPEPMFLSLAEESAGRLLVDVVVSSGHLQVRSSNGSVSFDGLLCRAATATSAAKAASSAQPQQLLLADPKPPGPCAVAMPATRPPGLEPWVAHGDCSPVHPATLDACFQLGHEVEVDAEDGATYVPSGLQGLVLRHHSSNVHTSVQAHPDSRAACVRLNHGMGCDKSLSRTSICGFEAKPIKARRHRQSSNGTAVKAMHKSSLMEVLWAVEAPEGKGESFLGAPACMVHSTGLISVTAASESLLQQGLLLPGETKLSVSARSLTGASGAVTGTNASLDSSAGVWGLMQTATTELKGSGVAISVRAEDVPGSSTVRFPSGNALMNGASLMSRTGARHQGMLVQSSAVAAPGHHQLLPNGRGTFGCLEARPLDTCHLSGQEVCVRVHAVGINFRDVLNVLGMYPGDPGPPGADMSGTVIAVGPDVKDVQEGQAVFGLAGGALGSHVICKEETLAALPPCLSYQQAATVPTVFVTVDMALEAAGAKAGDALLVHGGAGGIGLASVRMARCLGLEAVATAGSASKRCVLRTNEGVPQVLDSRATAFAGELPSLLPQGVQIVLNSLTSSGMVAASLASLAPGGCFVELSKRDIWSSGRVAAERPDVRYQLVAMDFLPGKLLAEKLAHVAQRLSRGKVAPLPSVVHSMSSVTVALRQMSQVRLTWPIETQQAPPPPPPNSASPES